MPLTQLNNRCLNKQKGFTLIMSLIILTILTILGLSSTQSTRTEVAMAGNMRESDISFQAAEAGLIASEAFIEQQTSTTVFNDLNGLIAMNTDEPDYFADDSWSSVQTATIPFHQTITVHTSPKFMLKHLGDRSQNDVARVNIGSGYGKQPPGKTVSTFRATSRGYGQTDRATRMIQSYYGKEF